LTDIIAPRQRFAPPIVVRQVIRYLSQATGLALIAVCIAVALALVSFAPADPSQNFATGAPLRNLIGPLGANVADFLFRGAGYAALFPVLLLAAWGWRLLMDHRLSLWRIRVLTMPIALLAAAAALASLERNGPWGLAEGAGGWSGALLLPEILSLLEPGMLAPSLVNAVIALAAIALTLFVLAIDLAEVQMIGRALSRGVAWPIGILRRKAGLGEFRRPSVKLPTLKVPAFLRRAKKDEGPAPIRHAGPAWASPTTSAPRTGPRAAPNVALPPMMEEEPEILLPFEEEPEGDYDFDNPPFESDPIATIPHSPEPPTQPAPIINVAVNSAPKPGSRDHKPQQTPLPLGDSASFVLPPVSLLQAPIQIGTGAVDPDLLTNNARMLESVLEDFGVRGEIMTVRPGPVVTLYELQPAPGTKASRVIGLADDIARNMSAVSVRIATIRGKNVIGIELPNKIRETVYMRELLGTQAYDKAQTGLPLILGKDIGGQPVITALERMPHLLIAGTTGSGKSVAINTMILSLLYALTPEQCRFIMVDPKMLELSVYDDIPHLLTPVVTDPRKAVVALKWAVREMENRYRAMSTLGVRNIKGYNDKIAEAMRKGDPMLRRVQTGFDPDTGLPIIEEQQLDMRPLPYIVIVVDEMADLMLVAGKDIEAAIQRLAQMARAAGIHLIMATQRPSVDVITGTIKANFPTRISFQVTSKIDSRTILGESGAEQLLGQGDMLYMAGGGRIIRAHGPFVSDEEVAAVADFLRDMGEPDYVDSVTEDDDIAAGIPGFSGESGDELYDNAVNIVLRERKASTSFLQRHLKIGYNRAASLIDKMEAEGVISTANHVGKREVLVPAAGDMV
jgi:S-DNA-T family DNA segregation ATPase FtsK/SpoIIIE